MVVTAATAPQTVTTVATQTADGPDADRDRPAITVGRVAAAALAATMAGFWIWAFVFAPRDNPDRLESEAYAAAAEPVCAATHDTIDALPSPRETPTPAQRLVPVTAATDLTRAMVADLHALALEHVAGDEMALVNRWLDDWDAYVDDRERYHGTLETADADATGRDLVFTLTERASGGIYTRRIEGFANVNDMPSCVIPGDI